MIRLPFERKKTHFDDEVGIVNISTNFSGGYVPVYSRLTCKDDLSKAESEGGISEGIIGR